MGSRGRSLRGRRTHINKHQSESHLPVWSLTFSSFYLLPTTTKTLNQPTNERRWRQNVRQEYTPCLAKKHKKKLSSPLSLFPLLENSELNEDFKVHKQIVARPTHSERALISFIVKKAKWGNESGVFSCVILASTLFYFFSFVSEKPKVRLAPCFCQTLVWGGFRPFSRSIFPTLYRSSLALLTSSLWVLPTWLWAKINAHMCLELPDWWRLERDTHRCKRLSNVHKIFISVCLK